MGGVSDWQRVKAIYNDALDRPEEQRAGFVSAACAGDGRLEAEVLKLLAADRGSEDFFHTLDRTLEAGLRGRGSASPWLGRSLGGYELVDIAGRGGMGTVFRARPLQGDGEEVAVKVLDTPSASVVSQKRFLLEQEGLQRLSHPNIAAFRSGGEGPDGTPYFVMDLVEGMPIDRYADRERLPVPARVRLMLPICDAVSHAHGRNIVHRDIKPSNILVTGEGKPMLLDLGLAKLLDPVRRGEPTELTLAGRAYTPLYSSPEQMEGSAVSEASDVFSLGAVLYKLLCGAPPLLLEGSASPPTRIFEGRASREETVAELRSTTTEALSHTLGGPLGRVLSRACHPTADGRHRSVEELVADLESALAAKPEPARGRRGLGARLRGWLGR